MRIGSIENMSSVAARSDARAPLRVRVGRCYIGTMASTPITAWSMTTGTCFATLSGVLIFAVSGTES
jgi:hypothetical protein